MSEPELIRLLERIRATAKGHMEYFAGEIFSDADAALRIIALIPPAAAPVASPHAPYCCADAKAGGPDHSMDCPHFAVPASPDLRGALVEARDALEQVWAAIGDMLLGEGPLSKEYAHGVTRKVSAALTQIRFTLSIAAAPAAVPDCPHCGSSMSRVQEAGATPPEFRECIDCGAMWQDPARRESAPAAEPRLDNLAAESPAPAAETGKAETRFERLVRVAGVRVLVEPCERGGHYLNENGVTFHPSKCAAPPEGEGT